MILRSVVLTLLALSAFGVEYRSRDFSYENAAGKTVTRKMAMWLPDKLNGQHSLLIFSHGLWSAPEHSSFLHKALAGSGYIVAAPHHKDAATEARKHDPVLPDFFRPQEWDDTRHADRAEDLHGMLDYLLDRDTDLSRHIHPSRIGAIGYSMGGYAVFGAIGGWPKWEDPRIKAALLCSPYIHPYLRSCSKVKVPVMMQGAVPGDFAITPFLPLLLPCLPKPRYIMVLKNENHFSWSNLVCKGQPEEQAVKSGSPELILRYSKAFFDFHLAGDQGAQAVLSKSDKALQSYRFDSK